MNKPLTNFLLKYKLFILIALVLTFIMSCHCIKTPLDLAPKVLKENIYNRR